MSADPLKPLIDAAEKLIGGSFLRSVRRWRDQVSLKALTAAIKAGDVDGAVKALGIEAARFRPLDAAITDTFESVGEDITAHAITNATVGLRVGPLFDIRAGSAEGWIRQHTTGLVTQITDDQRALVRQALAPLHSGFDPMMTGDSPQKLALDLVGRVNRATGSREGGLIGLTSQQAEWVANYQAELQGVPSADALSRKLRDQRFDRTIQKAIDQGREIPADTREAIVAAYKNRALRMRATTIARNEADAVSIQAQQEAWSQALDRGIVSQDKLARYWITAGDDRVRPTHRVIPGMNKNGVGFTEPFQTPKGPTMQPGWSFDPGCRCRVRIRVRPNT